MRCCGGTTTVGPILMLSLVASLAERRRMPVEGAAREGADMMMECVEFGFEEVCKKLYSCGLSKFENAGSTTAFIVCEPDR